MFSVILELQQTKNHKKCKKMMIQKDENNFRHLSSSNTDRCKLTRYKFVRTNNIFEDARNIVHYEKRVFNSDSQHKSPV